MIQVRTVFIVIFFWLSAARSAAALCCPTMEMTAKFPGWKILTLDDLPIDDQGLWQQYHGENSPGASSVVLGAGSQGCVVALLKREKGVVKEQLVAFIQHADSAMDVRVLAPPAIISTPFVVWKTGPGQFFNHATGKHISIAFDSVVYEKMESTSVQFYLRNGKIERLEASE